MVYAKLNENTPLQMRQCPNQASLSNLRETPNPMPFPLPLTTASIALPTAFKSPSNVTCPLSELIRPPYTALYPSGNIASLAKQTPSPLANAKLSYESAQAIPFLPSTFAPN